MISSLLLIASVALGASGDIYRCVGPDGKASFQDLPCSKGAATPSFKASARDGAADPRALRQWLEQLHRQARSAAVAAPAPRRSRTPAAESTGAALVVDQRQLAACSERFLACADGNPVRMDACVANMPRCSGTASTQCCPGECVARYATLRRDGAPLATAVRDALLDPDRPSCAARTGS